MKRKFIYFAAAVFMFAPFKGDADLLQPLMTDIYWQTPPYEEGGVCSVPNDFVLTPNAAPAPDAKPLIAIVIDDVGLDQKRSARAALLPPEVTLAYLPYSPRIEEQTTLAKSKGHMLIVHMPMEPGRKSADPGPGVLSARLPPLELHDRIVKNLSAFSGYVGVNNHMGSAFTQDAGGMSILMAELKSRKLAFLDSKTAPGSVGEKVAREAGVPTTHRDVFIDHVETPAKVAQALAQIEAIARQAGSVVAIGHPKDVTLSALEKWLPTLSAKGFRVVPLLDLIAVREAQAKRDTVAKNLNSGGRP